ncbi:MAG: DUF5615 family PIN-like protein [Caldilineaceae bacterium]|nr:DUF5615 family PIN-like protein [Caldilineaceae bacterium]
MNSLCFLLDEHIAHAIAEGLHSREAEIQVFTIGGPNAPATGTPDQDILIWVEEHGCLLITNNRKTMPGHLRNHVELQRHIPGIIVINQRMSWSDTIEELLLIWAASLPNEFQDQIVYLPLER